MSVTGPDGQITYAYDNEGKLLTQVNPNNTTTTYSYNQNRGWVTNIEHKLTSTNSVFANYALQYDTVANPNTVGNITKVTEVGSDQVTYQYDALYRLTQEIRSGSMSYTRNYTYDLAGNLETLGGATYSITFGTYDAANKFTTVPGGYATYDGDGDLTGISGTYILLDQQVENPSGDNYVIPAARFTWDERSKLTQHSIYSNPIDFGYNFQGKRVWSEAPSGYRIYYVFDGDNLIGEVTGSTPAPTMAYTWGADGLVSERLLGTSPSSAYYQYGPQGETRFLTNSAGAVLNSYYYNAYGRVLTGTGTTYNKHLYGGKYGYYSAGGMGLMLAGQRWYSSFVMKWLSRDPIKYRGGDNLYEYVGGNPVGLVDPLGLGSSPSGSPTATPTPSCNSSLWICQRPIDAWYGPIAPNHKYVCCKGPNQECYAHPRNDIKKGKPIPLEPNPSGSCREDRVCPDVRKLKCEHPVSPKDANTLWWNCRDWAEWRGE